ncbi:unnamed protein product [Closterium sp. NIES-54]
MYKIGTTICTRQDQVLCRTGFWEGEIELGELPVRFNQTEPKKAWRAKGIRGEGSERVYETRAARIGASLYKYDITLVELFGGLGEGLAAALEAGVHVKRWIYIKIDPEVRRMAWKHAKMLQQHYPAQLPTSEGRGDYGNREVRKNPRQTNLA